MVLVAVLGHFMFQLFWNSVTESGILIIDGGTKWFQVGSSLVIWMPCLDTLKIATSM